MSKAHGAEHGTIVKRVSRRHEEEAHGGSWKVAFADFTLALMCLFLVLWVLAARDKEEATRALESGGGAVMAEISGAKIPAEGGPRGSLIDRKPMPRKGQGEGPDEVRTVPGLMNPTPLRARYDTPEQMAELAALLARLSLEAGLSANLQTFVTPHGLRIMLHDTDNEGMFQLGSATPTPRFAALLDRMGPLFAKIQNPMLVVGHTDAAAYARNDPFGPSNSRLSSDRASAARAHLLRGGTPEASVLQVVGMAERAPVRPDEPLASVNRRIEIMVLTLDQARLMTAMFGQPAQAEPLLPGLRAQAPARDALAALRESVVAAGRQLPGFDRALAPSAEPTLTR
ncbi:MAG: OmpA family protein [Comamonadaceae bacterium]|uniref:Histidine kinase n=1 Tax=Hydrogenophaga borbori TaxID=2294117 RepID=A0A372EHU4_9BURK|nr:flagellar motor protein MotB [Hydrogenophaga borbori]NCT97794.1 OmpA family protein [Comamonadaceae bacterium]RFP78014.1 histidine kinase [Hydrogenophaga borbori]